MSNKEFKSLDEQVNLLSKRGLQISNTDFSKKFLHRNNYYRVSGYSLTLRNHDIFARGSTFENIVEIYNFDHKLRHILLKYIEEIEVAIKSIYAYEFTKLYGVTAYLDANNFTDTSRHKSIIDKAEQQKEKRLPNEPYLKHFVINLKEDIPFWAYVDLLTISDISFLYKISKDDVKLAVATAIGIPQKNGALLGRFMHSITIIRNLCAHGCRLFNRLFEQKPNLNKEEKQLLIINEDGTLDNSHLYGFILIMRRMLLPESFSTFKKELISVSEEYPFVRMNYFGFRSDWKEKL